MVSVPSDFSVVGTVLALAIAILLLSGLALYVAFRLRETLSDSKGGGARAAKVAFLIGLLFLSGGVFYFFAAGFTNAGGQSTQTNTTSLTTSSASTISSSTTSSGSSSSASSTTTSTATTASSAGSVSMQLSYPSSVNVGQGFYLTVSIFNSGSTTFAQAAVNIGTMASTFNIVNATVCNPQCQAVSWTGGVFTVGDLAPGSTVFTVGLKAPSSPAQFAGQTSLSYVGQSAAISLPVTIRVSGRP